MRDGSERFSLAGDDPGDVNCCKPHVDREIYILYLFSFTHLRSEWSVTRKHWDKCNVVPVLS